MESNDSGVDHVLCDGGMQVVALPGENIDQLILCIRIFSGHLDLQQASPLRSRCNGGDNKTDRVKSMGTDATWQASSGVTPWYLQMVEAHDNIFIYLCW